MIKDKNLGNKLTDQNKQTPLIHSVLHNHQDSIVSSLVHMATICTKRTYLAIQLDYAHIFKRKKIIKIFQSIEPHSSRTHNIDVPYTELLEKAGSHGQFLL